MAEQNTTRTNQEDLDEEAPIKAFMGRDREAEQRIKHAQEFPQNEAVKAKVRETGEDGKSKNVSRQFTIANSEHKNGEWHYQLKDSDGNLQGGGALFKESDLSWAVRR